MIVPQPDAAVAALHRLWTPLYVAFEHATQIAREFFESVGSPPAPWVYPSIVRWQVLEYLKEQGFDADASDVDFDGLPNHGIVIRHAGYTLRVMKSTSEGLLPGPGLSRAKQEFFQQLSLAPWGEEIRNLIVLWTPDQHFNLGSLSLACPKDGHGARAESYWLMEIQHPAQHVEVETASETTVNDLEMELEDTDAVSAEGDD